MKRIVQFETFSSIYNERLQEELKKLNENGEDYQVYSINLEKEANEFGQLYKDSQKKNILAKLKRWANFNQYLTNKYDYLKGAVVNVQYVAFDYFWLLPFLKKTFSKIILSFWGSDLLRQSNIRLKLMKVLFTKADIITVETEEVKRIFKKRVGNCFDKKIRFARFGISPLKDIDAVSDFEIKEFIEKYKINKSKKIITVGYNRKKAHQHIDAIKSILYSDINMSEIFVIIPWTYGSVNQDYKNEIEQLISNKFEYVFLEDQLYGKENACLRIISDILVQVQTTDTFSATMLETLYTKNEVLTGAWLPYDELYEAGICMSKVENVAEVGATLKQMIHNPLDENKKDNNKKVIKELSSWENTIQKWTALY